MIHPLKMAYIAYMRERGAFVNGDKNPNRTEIVAQKVRRLGIDNDAFVELAVSLWEKWSKEQGHPYPYWNMVTSDKTFEWIESLLELGQLNGDLVADDYVYEYMFAIDYVYWLLDGKDDKPTRLVVVGDETKIEVADALCREFGVACVSSDYSYIAQQVTETRDFR